MREYLQCKFSFSSPSICLVCLDCTFKQRFDCSIVFISCIFSHLPGISLSPLFKLFLILHICSYFLQISVSSSGHLSHSSAFLVLTRNFFWHRVILWSVWGSLRLCLSIDFFFPHLSTLLDVTESCCHHQFTLTSPPERDLYFITDWKYHCCLWDWERFYFTETLQEHLTTVQTPESLVWERESRQLRVGPSSICPLSCSVSTPLLKPSLVVTHWNLDLLKHFTVVSLPFVSKWLTQER